jgi:hypothetical protein
MSFERPGPHDKHKTVSDTEVNEALENDGLDNGDVDFDEVEHDEGQRAPGPVPDDEGRRPPRGQDVATEQGSPTEPPD